MPSIANRPDTVRARVTRVSPAGLTVEFGAGEVGRVRVRETCWDAVEGGRWRDRFPVGAGVDAVLLPARSHGCPELSIRLAERDPWVDIVVRHPVGAVRAGVVEGSQAYGVFVEIETGVTGLLHFSRLPTVPGVDAVDLFWAGDRVLVSIESIDPPGATIRSVRRTSSSVTLVS